MISRAGLAIRWRQAGRSAQRTLNWRKRGPQAAPYDVPNRLTAVARVARFISSLQTVPAGVTQRRFYAVTRQVLCSKLRRGIPTNQGRHRCRPFAKTLYRGLLALFFAQRGIRKYPQTCRVSRNFHCIGLQYFAIKGIVTAIG